MFRFLSLLPIVAIMAPACASSNSTGLDEGNSGSVTGGAAGFQLSGGAGDSATRSGGRTVATPAMLDQIENSSCATWDSALAVVPSMLDFVVDTSGSMGDLAPYSTSSKWEVTRDAISAAIDNVLPDATAVGALLYPNEATTPNDLTASSAALPVETCIDVAAMVNVAPIGASGSAQRAALAKNLANAQPAGGTPTDDAYTYAVANAAVPALVSYPDYLPYMVLITDGQPTILQGCRGTGDPAQPVDWQPIVDHIAQAAGAPNYIKTFVIGSPGSDAQSMTGVDGRPWLSMAARAGLTPRSENCDDNGPNYCHIDLSQSTDLATDLEQGLTDIIRAIPCNFNTPSAPSGATLDPDTLNVVYRSQVKNNQAAVTWIIGQSDASCGTGGTADGWYIDSHTGGLALCPATCQAVQDDPLAQLDVYAGCQTITPLPQ